MSEVEIVTAGRPLPRIANVQADTGLRALVSWSTGPRAGKAAASVDLSSVIFTFKIYAPLRDNDALFKTVHIGGRGSRLLWGDDGAIDMAATTVERLADEEMTSEDFEAFLEKNNFTWDAAAAQLGISRRLVGYYAKGQPIPRYIALACAQLGSTGLRWSGRQKSSMAAASLAKAR